MRRWIPNALTALRLILLPVLMAQLFRIEHGAGAGGRAIAIGLYAVIAATDWFDGYLARRLDAISRWGSVADALIDRLTLQLPLFYFALWRPAAFTDVPLWLPLWILGLDLLVAISWSILRAKDHADIPAVHTPVGRVAAGVLFVLVLWVIAGLHPLGVLIGALAGGTLASASASMYVRRWLAG